MNTCKNFHSPILKKRKIYTNSEDEKDKTIMDLISLKDSLIDKNKKFWRFESSQAISIF
jgi:hypothetical protein